MLKKIPVEMEIVRLSLYVTIPLNKMIKWRVQSKKYLQAII